MPKPVKDTMLAYILWIPSFFGVAGLHRLYLGKWGTAILWFFTGGLFLIGTIIDFFLMRGLVESANRRV